MILTGIGALLLYGATAAPGIVEFFDDTLEFQVVGPTFGIAHPTGYPLYILLSGLWTRFLFPFGEWAWRMNLFSALTGALALALLARTGTHLALEPSNTDPVRQTRGLAHLRMVLGGLAPVIVFGLGAVWWSQTTEAEVYGLHLVFVALILNQTLVILQSSRLRHSPPKNRPAPPQYRPLLLLCLWIGLGLTHHRMVVLLLPAVAVVLLWQMPWLLRPGRHWAGLLAALLGPLLLYLWIPLRAQMGVRDLHGSYENSWQGFWDHVLARRYVAFFDQNPLMIERGPAEWLQLFVEQMGWPGLILAGVGLLHPLLARRLTPAWLLVILALAANLLFALNYRVGDVEVFLLPAFFTLALLAGLGFMWLWRLLAVASVPRAVAPTTAIVLLGVLILGLGGRTPFTSRAQEWAAHDAAYLLATVDFPPQSRVIGLEGEITALHYMQSANGLAPQARGVVANLPEARRAAIQQAVEQGDPVFITREVEGIGAHYHFDGAGPLVRVSPRNQPPALPPLPRQVDYTLEGAPLRLDSAHLFIRELPGGPRLQIELAWEVLELLSEDYTEDYTENYGENYKVSLRLLQIQGNEYLPLYDDNGNAIVHDDFPLRQTSLTSEWPVGTPIRDVHFLPIPSTLSSSPSSTHPADVRFQLIVYHAETVAEVGRWETGLDLVSAP